MLVHRVIRLVFAAMQVYFRDVSFMVRPLQAWF